MRQECIYTSIIFITKHMIFCYIRISVFVVHRSSRPEMSATESERKWTPGPNEDSVSKRSTYPDNQQLFVGNLPHSVTDKELQEFFERKSSAGLTVL